MGENIISLISMILGICLISTVIVSGRFKGNVNSVVSLIIAVTVVGYFSKVDLPKFESDFSYSNEYGSYDYTESYVENFINEKIKETLSSNFKIEDIFVESNISLYEDSLQLEYVNIHIKTDTPLSEILFFSEREFDLAGRLRVYRIL